MTKPEPRKKTLATFDLLASKYGPLMSLKDVAEVLKFPTIDSVRKALARRTLTLAITRLPNRREIFVKTNEVAAYVDNDS